MSRHDQVAIPDYESDMMREDVESDLIHAYPDLYSLNDAGLLVYKNGFNNPEYIVDIGVYLIDKAGTW